MAGLYEEYSAYVQKYRSEYGERTIVLYRCGSFYEIYSADDGLVDIKGVSELLNIQVSRRNKAILEVNRSNFNMAGFPAWALKKFVNTLVCENYTVVIVDQVSDPPKPKRAVTEIVSPGTKVDDIVTFESPVLLVAFFEEHLPWRGSTRLLAIGVALIDLSTGKSRVGEFVSTAQDSGLALDELYKTLAFYTPKEVVLASSEPLEGHTYEELVSALDLSGSCAHNRMGLVAPAVTRIQYQDQLLRKVHPGHGLLSVFEYLELERMQVATVAYVLLLEFCHKHNESAVRSMGVPGMLYRENSQLLLSYNTCKQLNITAGGAASLLGLLNTCVTAIGKRAYKDRLLTPMASAEDITKSYDKVESFMGIHREAARHLAEVYDMERLYRRMVMGRLHPADFAQIDATLGAVLALSGLVPFERADEASGLRERIRSVIDMQECPKYHLDNVSGSFFVRGNFPEIDALQDRLSRLKSFFDVLAGNIHPEHCKVECNDRDGYHLTMTAKRFSDVKAGLRGRVFQVYEHGVAFNDIVARPVSSSSSVVRLTEVGAMKGVNGEIVAVQQELCAAVLSSYREFVAELADAQGGMFLDTVGYICEVDWFASCAKNSAQFGYVRPAIEDRHGGRSYVDAVGLRHPVIERILSQTDYVPNSVRVGTDGSRGMLLYGINSSGKSSLSKSIGIAVIMAQAGMYVPAAGMAYWPYRSLFTRIPSGDDLARGQSTFVVEVCEMRNILKRADRNSLVIGDELASGTESVSALAIVGAGIDALHARGASFVFATHLHDLCGLSRVRALEGVTVCHLGVRYDQGSQRLIYDRKLVAGQGSTLYGLEVCKSLSLGEGFLEVANEIRREVLEVAPNVMSRKQSVYNAGLYVDECGVCGARAEEVHHIEPQAMADDRGFVGHRHKNRLSNLVALCGPCHDKVHSGELKVDGYVQTSEGLSISVVPSEGSDEKNEGSIEKNVKELKSQGRSVKQIADALSMTQYRVRKVLSAI